MVGIAPVPDSNRFSHHAQAMSSIDTLDASSRSEVQRRVGKTTSDSGVADLLMQNLVMRNNHSDRRLNLSDLGASLQALCNFPTTRLDWRYERPMTA